MLRVTVHDASDAVTFQLEGRLVGPWAAEAQACWQRTLSGAGKPVLRVDLSDVTLIDEAGMAFLTAAHARGAELVASGCLMTALVAELTNRPLPDGGCT